MPERKPSTEPERMRRKALSRWEDEGGAEPCGPQVPGVAKDCAEEGDLSPSRLIDERIAAIGGWRGEALARMRALIGEADPEVVETVKWRKPSNPAGVPVWEHGGIICSGDAFKDKVKLTFAKGAALEDPAGVFNAGFGGNTWRAIDLREGDALDEEAFKALIRAAVVLNLERSTAR